MFPTPILAKTTDSGRLQLLSTLTTPSVSTLTLQPWEIVDVLRRLGSPTWPDPVTLLSKLAQEIPHDCIGS